MHGATLFTTTLALGCITAGCAQNIILTNDDGWATAQVRAQFSALTSTGFDVVLSAPAVNMSGTGSTSATPTPLSEPCEFDTCPTGSPAEGFNASDPRLNYVNAFPVDAARYGIQTLAPQFFGGPPELVVSGPNIGSNLGVAVFFSGTLGAACEAAKEGIPSVAFSGTSGSQVSYTTLTSTPNATSTLAAETYSALTATFVQALTSSGISPLLPGGITLNVNYPSVDACPSPADYQWVLSRVFLNILATDVETCGSTTLPLESNVVAAGCFASVSVVDASTKMDANLTMQAAVLQRLVSLPLSCLPS
ncbi:sure-like protein [Sparassis latifolia]